MPSHPGSSHGSHKSGGLTSGKAKEILRDGKAQGKTLTRKQKKFFGAVAGGASPRADRGFFGHLNGGQSGSTVGNSPFEGI